MGAWSLPLAMSAAICRVCGRAGVGAGECKYIISTLSRAGLDSGENTIAGAASRTIEQEGGKGGGGGGGETKIKKIF